MRNKELFVVNPIFVEYSAILFFKINAKQEKISVLTNNARVIYSEKNIKKYLDVE